MKLRALALLGLVVAAAVAWAAPSTVSAAAAPTCPELLVRPEDLGPGFVAFDPRLNTRPGAAWCDRQYVQTRVGHSLIELDGYLGLVTLASVWPDPATAARRLAELRQELIAERGGVELPLPLVAEEAYSAIVWSEEPFDVAEQIVLLRTGNRVGGLVLATQGRPDRVEQLLPLAELAAARLKG